jgi:hypothetical protein
MNSHLKLLILIMIFIFGIIVGAWIAITPQNFNWITALSSALLTPIVAILGAWIAWAQWKINQRRLQHELFDRRIKLYQVVAAYIANAISLGDVEKGEEYQFLRDTKHSIFIFDKEIADYTDGIYKKSIDLQFLSNRQRQLQGKALEEVSEKRQKVFKWFTDELNTLPKKFEKFLEL